MQAGNLVMIARTSVGVPANTMALLIENQKRLGKTPVWLAKLVVSISNRALEGPENPYIITDDDPEEWKPARNFFVVSRA